MAAMGDWRSALATRWRATASGPFFEMMQPPAECRQALPADYFAAVTEFAGREGFLGKTYLRLYRLEELAALNLAYEVPVLFPEAMVFGSDGGGNGFAFLVNEPAVVQVPFLPLCAQYAERRALNFTDPGSENARSEQDGRPAGRAHARRLPLLRRADPGPC
ncbi:MAG TPA: hypothetical protein VGY66_11580 [Gemmataceae bacterium]|nr:hypothetical protein [Gemmataceae bacterium]